MSNRAGKAATTCQCGNMLARDSDFCRKCGLSRRDMNDPARSFSRRMETDGHGNTTVTEYDGDDNLVKTAYYDRDEKEIKYKQGDQAKHHSSYTKIVTQTDQNGVTTVTEYNADGDVIHQDVGRNQRDEASPKSRGGKTKTTSTKTTRETTRSVNGTTVVTAQSSDESSPLSSQQSGRRGSKDKKSNKTLSKGRRCSDTGEKPFQWVPPLVALQRRREVFRQQCKDEWEKQGGDGTVTRISTHTSSSKTHRGSAAESDSGSESR